MSTLQDFLNQNVVEGMTKEVAISERFKDEKGNLLKFKIGSISAKEVRELRTKHTKINKKGEPEVDHEGFSVDVVLDHTLEPNFKDAESLKKTGCVTAYQYLNKVLLAGEVSNLNKAILEFSGFGTDIDDLVEEVKN